MVCYPDLVLLLSGDYKRAPRCYFPLFWLNLQSSKKMNPAKITSQRISSCEKEEVWNPNQAGPEWWTGILDVCSCLAGLPLYQPWAALNTDTALSCCWQQQGTTGGFPIPFAVGYFGSISEDGLVQQARASTAPAAPVPAQDSLQFHSNNSSQPWSHQPLLWGRLIVNIRKKPFSHSWNWSWATDDNDRSIAVNRC